MGIVVLGAVFVDIKGYPADVYIPGGRNAGRVEIVHGGVSRNLVEDIAPMTGSSENGFTGGSFSGTSPRIAQNGRSEMSLFFARRS